MERNRLEAFSDGVLAIIITIMVLELKQPVGDSIGDLWALAPVLLAYLVSFLFIAIYWVNHHILLNKAKKVNLKILWCNIGWLFVMSFIPFTTVWVGSYPNSFAPISVYFADMALASIAFHLMYYFITCENKEKFKLGVRSIVSLAIYILATCFGGFFPTVSIIVVALVSCWWIFPEKRKTK